MNFYALKWILFSFFFCWTELRVQALTDRDINQRKREESLNKNQWYTWGIKIIPIQHPITDERKEKKFCLEVKFWKFCQCACFFSVWKTYFFACFDGFSFGEMKFTNTKAFERKIYGGNHESQCVLWARKKISHVYTGTRAINMNVYMKKEKQ